MLHFQLDIQSGVPVYRQLMDQIRYYVASGTLAPGDQLPSIRELAKNLTVNPTTIVKAYGELDHEGVVELRHGRGVFIAESPPAWPKERRRERLNALSNQLSVEARQMGASDGEVLDSIRRALDSLPDNLRPSTP